MAGSEEVQAAAAGSGEVQAAAAGVQVCHAGSAAAPTTCTLSHHLQDDGQPAAGPGVFKCVMQARRCPNHLHYVTPSAGRWATPEIPPVHGISSAVAAPPLKGKLTARIAMAAGAAYARMANRGTGAVIVVGKPDVLMAYSAASAQNAEDQAYARMGK